MYYSKDGFDCGLCIFSKVITYLHTIERHRLFLGVKRNIVIILSQDYNISCALTRNMQIIGRYSLSCSIV